MKKKVGHKKSKNISKHIKTRKKIKKIKYTPKDSNWDKKKSVAQNFLNKGIYKNINKSITEITNQYEGKKKYISFLFIFLFNKGIHKKLHGEKTSKYEPEIQIEPEEIDLEDLQNILKKKCPFPEKIFKKKIEKLTTDEI